MAKPYDGEERRHRDPEPWHLKKEVNVSLILVALAQLATFVWYASDFNAWRRETDKELARHDTSIIEAATKNQDFARELADRLARIETKLDALKGTR
jgi:hypothetical protein